MCNTDRLSGASGATCGGLFQDYRDLVCGAFVHKLGLESTYFAEFFAVLLAVEIARAKGWLKIWFEMDSALTLLLISSIKIIPPWQLRRQWERCLRWLQGVEFRTSHIYREGNVAAVILSNVALSYDDFTWRNYVIPYIKHVVLADSVKQIGYRHYKKKGLLR